MFEIDKVKFGAFVAQLRKEQGMTQKELAQKLYISDKAVSKWETGINTPDVALLIPLADLLGVTVTELLECKRMEVYRPMEEMVKKAVRYSEKERARVPKGKRLLSFGIAVLLSIVQVLVIINITGGYTVEMTSLLLMPFMGGVFGGYFWLFAGERLPTCYDENRISVYADVVFRLHVPGLALNNSNWPYILRVGRLWTLAMMDLYPILFVFGTHLLGDAWLKWVETALTVLFLLGLLIPIYVVGKKYE